MNPPSSSWTLESLKQHIEDIISGCDRRHSTCLEHLQDMANQAREDAREAIAKAERASEKRFDSVNEFRAVLSDQQQRLIPREEAIAKIEGLQERIDLVAARIDKMEGSGIGKHALWGYFVGAIGVIIMIISVIVMVLKK